MKMLVRCLDRSVFEIDPFTLDAKSCGYYDAYCYSDPLSDVKYIEYSDWVIMRNTQWDKQYRQNYESRN